LIAKNQQRIARFVGFIALEGFTIHLKPAGSGSLKRIICHQFTVQPNKLFGPLWA
jgi:hypothetical protein